MNEYPETCYRLIRVLGEGGDGTVFLAESAGSDFRALKIFHDDCFAQQELACELSIRLRSWIDLGSHPFLVEALSCGFYSNRAVLVMEYVAPDRRTNNSSLQDYLCNSDGPVNLRLSIRWATQICCAMEHANRHGVTAHGDIKPSNILITPDKDAKLTDFGCTLRPHTAERHSNSPEPKKYLPSRWPLLANGGFIRGTPGYISPEAYRGERADVRSDLFSFGVVLWQLATDHAAPPFFDRTTSSPDSVYRNQMLRRVPDTTGPLDPVIRRCLCPDPGGRFDNFISLRQELERLVQ